MYIHLTQLNFIQLAYTFIHFPLPHHHTPRQCGDVSSTLRGGLGVAGVWAEAAGVEVQAGGQQITPRQPPVPRAHPPTL